MTDADHADRPITPEELGRLLDRHAAALELFARQWTRSAEDCVQEALVELAGQVPVPADPVAWLYRVVRNRAINQVRSERRRRAREEARTNDRDNWFCEDPAAQLDGEQATRALQQLPDRQRQAVVARIWGGLTFEQISELLGTSLSGAHRDYAAGLAALRTRLETPCRTNEAN